MLPSISLKLYRGTFSMRGNTSLMSLMKYLVFYHRSLPSFYNETFFKRPLNFIQGANEHQYLIRLRKLISESQEFELSFQGTQLVQLRFFSQSLKLKNCRWVIIWIFPIQQFHRFLRSSSDLFFFLPLSKMRSIICSIIKKFHIDICFFDLTKTFTLIDFK